MFKKLDGSSLATIMGLATSLCTAYAVLDLDTMDFHLFKTWFKLIIIGLPAIGGWMSTINKPMK